MRPIPSKERRWLGWVACVLSAALGLGLWLFWVLPVHASVAQAEPGPSGASVSVRLEEGQWVGIWASGPAATLGTLECAVRLAGGGEVAVERVRDLSWNDTLWWVTPRAGFESYAGFSAGAAGDYSVSCSDSIGSYEATYLLAKDPQAPGWIGLGRGGSADYRSSSVLAYGAVVAPLLAVLLLPIMGVQSLRARRQRRRPRQNSASSSTGS